jgi:hypothetical protein
MLMGEEWVQFGRHGFRFDRIVRYQEEEEDDPGGAVGPDGDVVKRPTGTIRVYYGNRGAFRLNRPEADAFRRFIGDRVRTTQPPEVRATGQSEGADINTKGAR